MRTLLAATALASLLAAAPALAQDATPVTPAPAADAMKPAAPTTERFITMQAPDDWVASKLIGSTVYGAADEKLGDINDVVADGAGQVKAIVIGVGGFLGIGEKNVAVAPTTLERVADGNNWKYRLTTTKEELTAAPEFKTAEAVRDEMDKSSTGSTAPADPANPMAPTAPSPTQP